MSKQAAQAAGVKPRRGKQGAGAGENAGTYTILDIDGALAGLTLTKRERRKWRSRARKAAKHAHRSAEPGARHSFFLGLLSLVSRCEASVAHGLQCDLRRIDDELSHAVMVLGQALNDVEETKQRHASSTASGVEPENASDAREGRRLAAEVTSRQQRAANLRENVAILLSTRTRRVSQARELVNLVVAEVESFAAVYVQQWWTVRSKRDNSLESAAPVFSLPVAEGWRAGPPLLAELPPDVANTLRVATAWPDHAAALGAQVEDSQEPDEINLRRRLHGDSERGSYYS